MKVLVLLMVVLAAAAIVAESPIFMCPSTKSGHSGINVAHLNVNAQGVNQTVILQLVSTECHTCYLQNISFIPASEKNCSLLVDTRWPVHMAVSTNLSSLSVNDSCNFGTYTFQEGGVYLIYVSQKNDRAIHCLSPVLQNSPPDSNIALYGAIGIFAGIALLWIAIVKGRRRCLGFITEITPSERIMNTNGIMAERDLGTPTNASLEQDGKVVRERLKSLDTFRGLSLVIMMFVNYGGAEYWFFKHSKWNGLTVADLVFPWFIWIMGTALAYSFQSLARSKKSLGSIFLKICRRSLTLFALGILVNSGGSDNFKHWRIMGVLQRFALTYFVTATSQLAFMVNASKIPSKNPSLKDLTLYWKEWIVQLSLVVIHLCLTFLLQVPGCPTGYLGPGGIANDGGGADVFNCTGGAAGYIDKTVLGDALTYKTPTSMEIYDSTVPFDPEGILGTLNSCFLCFLGLQAGKILIIFPNAKDRIKRFLIWALITGIVAGILCKFSKNDGWIPVNKNLWSLSYILAMSSMAFVLFTFCYIVIDVYKYWTGAPFYYPGMNSIIVYVSHEVFPQPWMTFWAITPSTHATYFLINTWDVTFWVLLSAFLHSKKIFINV